MDQTIVQKCIYWCSFGHFRSTQNVLNSNSSLSMDELIQKISLLGENIFSLLGNKSLTQCMESSRLWNDFILNEKLLWIRIIQAHVTNFDETWKNVITETNTDMVQDLAVAVQNFFNPRSKTILTDFEPKREAAQFLPLHIVAESGTLDLFQHIIQKNGTVNIPNQEGWTPLHYAAMSDNLDKYQLIKAGDNNPKSKLGFTPFHVAASCGNIEVCKLLPSYMNEKDDYGCTGLYCAAKFGQLNTFSFIFDNVEDKNPASNVGTTPLHVAALNGYLDICKLIIENVDDKNPAMHDGTTPLYVAAQEGYFDIRKLIVENVDDKNPV